MTRARLKSDMVWSKIVGVIVVPILVMTCPVWLLLMAFGTARRHVRSRHFRRRHVGQVFFIWRSRRSWHDFVSNNVLPVLPREIFTLAERRRKSDPLATLYRTALDWHAKQQQRPWLVFVTLKRIHVVSLHEPLRALKPHAARAAVVQQRVWGIVRTAILRETASNKLNWRPLAEADPDSAPNGPGAILPK